MESEAKLQSQLLDLLEAVQGVYRTRYLQAFDEVTGKCEEVRTEIDSLPESRPFKAIAELVKIDALASVNVATLKDEVAGYKDGLFQSSLDRNAVERALKDRPQPEGCSLHVDEADGLVAAAEEALDQAKGEVQCGAAEHGEPAAATGSAVAAGARQAGEVHRRRAGRAE